MGERTVNTGLAGKQDKLINPLTQTDVVNNLTSTATNKPLSAAQGRALANGSARDSTKLPLKGNSTITGDIHVTGSVMMARGSGAYTYCSTSNHSLHLEWGTDARLYLYIDGTRIGVIPYQQITILTVKI